ncbi:MAG: helix-turn-helix domain-containing protein [Clostridiales bacterium]|nr:helix-turn-helix domain-containing protein [Clostridiales bacterium]MDY4181765.1 helix-turn-helix transcriptional regulator [Pseudoflavonifractor sp.]
MDKKTDLSIQVGKRIRALRQEQGITVERLAEAADISVQYMSEIERGKKNMTIPILKNMVEALHTSADYLLFGTTELDPACDIVSRRLAELIPVERDMVARCLLAMTRILEDLGLERE